MIPVKHIVGLARAIAVVGLVLCVIGVLLLSIMLVSLITDFRIQSALLSLIIYSVILLIAGWHLMRKAGKYAVKISGWSQDWIGDADETEERAEPIPVVKMLNAEAVALTVIGMMYIVSGIYSLADLLYDELFGPDLSSLFSRDIFSSMSSWLSKDLYLGAIELVLGTVLLLKQRTILGWLRRIHEPGTSVEPDDQMPSEV